MTKRAFPAPEAAARRGMLRERQDDFVGAAAAYQIAIDSGNPEWAPKAAINLGNLRERQDDFVGAAAAYQIVIDSGNPEWAPKAAINLGMLRERQDDFVGAAAAYQIVIDSGNPEWAPKAAINLGMLPAAAAGRGMACEDNKDFAGAAAAYQIVIDSGNPEWAPRAAINLGMLRERQDDFVGAAAAYQIAIDSGNPEWAPRAAINLGMLRERQDDFVGAAAAYQIVIDSGNPEWAPRAAINLGMLRERQDDFVGAAAAYQIAIDSGNPEWAPKAAINLGMACEDNKDFAGAAAAYQTAIDSGNPEWAPKAAIKLGAQFQHKLSDLARAEAAYQLAIDLGADRETVEFASSGRLYAAKIIKGPAARSPGKKSLKSLLFTAAGLAELAPPRASAGDDVDVSVFAPPRAVRGEAMLVLVALHVPEQADHAAALAAEADPDTGRRGVRSLAVPVQLDMPLTIELSLPGFEMDSELQEFCWRGSARLVQFEVFVPEKLERRTVIGTVTVSTNGIPIGHLKWKLPIDPIEHQEGAAPVAQGEHVARYRQAFISYASVDRKEVLARVQMLRTLGVGYFQDILNLDPGDRWEHELYREIDHCDLFLLFWSSAAKESTWVRRETEAALRLAKQNDPFGPPELRPVLIEGPPVPPPWPELAHLHFNDRLSTSCDECAPKTARQTAPPLCPAPSELQPSEPPCVRIRIRLWDAGTGRQVGVLTGHRAAVETVAFSPDGRRLVSGADDNTLRVWDALSWQPLIGHGDRAAAKFSDDGRRIVSGGSDKTVRWWDAATGRPIGEPLLVDDNDIRELQPLNEDRLASFGNTVRLWDAHTRTPIGETLRLGPYDLFRPIAIDTEGHKIAARTQAGVVQLWDAATMRPVGEPITPEGWPEGAATAISFSLDGRIVATGSFDGTVRLWDAGTGKPIGQPMTGKEQVTYIAFSRDGHLLAVGTMDNTLRLWDTTTFQPLGDPMRTDAAVNVATFSRDGRTLASGSNDGSIRLWDVGERTQLGAPLTGHTAVVVSLDFSPDGTKLLSGSGDHTLRMWPVPAPSPDGLCDKLTHNMSHKQWRDWVSPDIDYITTCPDLRVAPD